MAKKKKQTVRERLEAVVQDIEIYEASQRIEKDKKKAAKKEEKEPFYVQVLALADKEPILDLMIEAAAKKREANAAKELFEGVTEALLQVQFEHDWDGLQFGDIKFRAAMQDGRETLDKQKLRDVLLLKGVDLDVIDEAFDLATSRGEPFVVRKLTLPGLDD